MKANSIFLTLRALLISSALLLTAVLAHIGGCGSFITPDRMWIEFLSLFLLFVIFSSRKLEGPRLGTLIVFSQLSVHFILGGMMMNNSRMLLFHFVAGFLAYPAIKLLENALQRKYFKITLLIRRYFSIAIELPSHWLASTTAANGSYNYCLREAKALRAPPARSRTR